MRRVEEKERRIRDPIHGLIAFTAADDRETRLDQTAWKLLNTPSFKGCDVFGSSE